MEYRQFEAALAELHFVEEADLKAFRARLRLFRDMGVPDVPRTGKGTRLTFGFEHLWETQLALVVGRSGLPPQRSIELAIICRNARTVETVQAHTGPDLWFGFGIMADAENPDDANSAIVTHVAPLRDHVAMLEEDERDGAAANIFSLINISELTRDVEAVYPGDGKEEG